MSAREIAELQDRVEELEGDVRIWREKAMEVVKKLEKEQAKVNERNRLIWSIVMGSGGGLKLSNELLQVRDDEWEILEYDDHETMSKVIRARRVGVTDTRYPPTGRLT